MAKFHHLAVAALSVATIVFGKPAFSQQTLDLTTRVGVLSCLVQDTSGFVVFSTKRLSCLYEPGNASEPVGQYTGTINSFGLELGSTTDAIMSWAVVQTGTGNVYGLLEGRYAGVSASASAGEGGGANILVGGFDRSIALQPFSLQSQSGLNLAIGVSQLELVAR